MEENLSIRTKAVAIIALAIASWAFVIIFGLICLAGNIAHGSELDPGTKNAIELFDEEVGLCVADKNSVSCRQAIHTGQTLIDHGYCLASISEAATSNNTPFVVTLWREGMTVRGTILCDHNTEMRITAP